MTQRPLPASGPRAAAGPLGGADAASEYVQRRTQDGVAILTMAGPDGNRLGPYLVRALTKAIATALRDEGVRALVLTARGADFCAGPWTDLPPPGPDAVDLPPVIADLATLCATIEAAHKPLVCAIHGRVFSGGLALALAARRIIADTRTTLHFPEPRLGRLPPGNGTVRLCWRLGAVNALKVLQSPGPLTAADVPGLVDDTVPENLVPTALAMADALAMNKTPRQEPTGLSASIDYRAAVQKARAALPTPLPSHRAHEADLLDTVEAAQLLPADQALAFDLVRAQDAALAPVARALAHLARATRRALITPEAGLMPDGVPRTGPILAALSPENAARLVPTILRHGVDLTLTAPDRAPLAQALESVAQAQLDRVTAGQLTQADSERDWNRLSGRLDPDPGARPAMAFADLEHAAWLETMVPALTPLILWSPGAHALPGLTAPTQAVALVPAPSRAPRLCEIVVQSNTDTTAIRHATTFALRQKLTPIRVQGAPILPVLAQAAAAAAQCLRAKGVTSAALRATGLLHNGAELGEAAQVLVPLPQSAERLVLLAVVNAGARLLREGACLRPSDIDLAMVLGAGWPNWRGGPMAEADGIGPMVLRHECQQAETVDAALWSPDPLFDQLIRDGQRFEDLNRRKV